MNLTQVHEAKHLKCLHCQIPFPKTFTMGKTDGKLRKNQLLVCSHCGGIMILGDSDWRPFLKADFEALPPQTKRALMVTVKGLAEKLQAGKEWSPYAPPSKN